MSNNNNNHQFSRLEIETHFIGIHAGEAMEKLRQRKPHLVEKWFEDCVAGVGGPSSSIYAEFQQEIYQEVSEMFRNISDQETKQIEATLRLQMKRNLSETNEDDGEPVVDQNASAHHENNANSATATATAMNDQTDDKPTIDDE